MPDYRHWYVPGGTFFFTLVTHHRRPISCTDLARRCLREAIDVVRTGWPCEFVAIVLLRDHLHTVWTLPPGDARYPMRWKRIKEQFTRRYLNGGGRRWPFLAASNPGVRSRRAPAAAKPGRRRASAVRFDYLDLDLGQL